LIVVCARCHCCCRHLFVATATVAAVTIVNATTIATTIAAAITAIVAVTNAVVTVVVAISTAVAADNNGYGSIFKSLGWLWVVV
jgi:hypothetical protein